MSSEKPFWEGKTRNEMAGLHVKVTFKNGNVVTGVTGENGDIEHVCFLSSYRGNEKFVPNRYIESVELLDDTEYERIDNIEDAHEGDIFVADDGNRYRVTSIDIDDMNADGARCFVRVNGAICGCFWISNRMFAYALRRKPKLPDHDGLWLDRDGNTWTMRDGSMQLTCVGADGLCFTRPWFSPDSVQVLTAAPFRPAKAVEA